MSAPGIVILPTKSARMRPHKLSLMQIFSIMFPSFHFRPTPAEPTALGVLDDARRLDLRFGEAVERREVHPHLFQVRVLVHVERCIVDLRGLFVQLGRKQSTESVLVDAAYHVVVSGPRLAALVADGLHDSPLRGQVTGTGSRRMPLGALFPWHRSQSSRSPQMRSS